MGNLDADKTSRNPKPTAAGGVTLMKGPVRRPSAGHVTRPSPCLRPVRRLRALCNITIRRCQPPLPDALIGTVVYWHTWQDEESAGN